MQQAEQDTCNAEEQIYSYARTLVCMLPIPEAVKKMSADSANLHNEMDFLASQLSEYNTITKLKLEMLQS